MYQRTQREEVTDMTDYAKQDVDSLRAIAKYCGGTEYGIFLDELADRMEDVVSDVVQPVFTPVDVSQIGRATGVLRELIRANSHSTDVLLDDLEDLADRIEQTLPIEAAPVDVT